MDPGEDTGFAIWRGAELHEASTAKLWRFGDALWAAVFPDLFDNPVEPDPMAADLRGPDGTIDMIVVENFSIYPWEARQGSLDWDEVRTARLIGSIFQLCRLANITYVQQDAKIKERAVAAGAETYFITPLTENRHANDAIMHGVYWQAHDLSESAKLQSQ